MDMVRKALDAFVDLDVARAQEVIKTDSKVDHEESRGDRRARWLDEGKSTLSRTGVCTLSLPLDISSESQTTLKNIAEEVVFNRGRRNRSHTSTVSSQLPI